MSSTSAVDGVAPRYRNVPPAPTTAGLEVVELAASCGLILDGWEALVLEEFLGERVDGRWSTFENVLIVPRQNGKGAILEARELAGLFYFKERLIVHSAHEFKTSKEAFRRISALIRESDDLERQVKRRLENNNGMLIELLDGCRLVFLARSTGSGRGFTGDVVILDEAYNLSEKMMAALVPTMSARPNPQLWLTSSAPLPEDFSAVLRRACARGRHGVSSSLAYLEWCADDDADASDVEVWRTANPALGIRISEEFVGFEHGILAAEDFRRERLGFWVEDFDAGERVIPDEVWAACWSEQSRTVGDVVFGVDTEANRSHSAIVVAAPSSSGGLHVEVVDFRPGTEWLVGRLEALRDQWHCPMLMAANSPAASLTPELERAGVEVLEVSTVDLARACGLFYDLAHQRQLCHLGQTELSAALAGAERRYLSDAWVWSRRASSAPISPVVAATLAVWGVSHAPAANVEPWAVFR